MSISENKKQFHRNIISSNTKSIVSNFLKCSITMQPLKSRKSSIVNLSTIKVSTKMTKLEHMIPHSSEQLASEHRCRGKWRWRARRWWRRAFMRDLWLGNGHTRARRTPPRWRQLNPKLSTKTLDSKARNSKNTMYIIYIWNSQFILLCIPGASTLSSF